MIEGRLLKKAADVVLLFMIMQPCLYAVDVEPSDESVRELLLVTQKKKELEGRLSMIESLMMASMKNSIGNGELTKEQRTILSDEDAKIFAIFKDEMSWESIEPSLIDYYKKTFSQKELDGMLQFYKSPAGQAVIAKMPIVLQNKRALMEGRMSAMQPKLDKLLLETTQRLKQSMEVQKK